MPETVTTFCRICEVLCGLRVTREHGKVTAIDPIPSTFATEGFAGVKGLKQHRLYDSPDRVRFPMKRASRARGVNVNLLAADGPDRLEPLSGMAHLTGIPVDVCPARRPLAPDSWSGIAPY